MEPSALALRTQRRRVGARRRARAAMAAAEEEEEEEEEDEEEEDEEDCCRGYRDGPGRECVSNRPGGHHVGFFYR